MNKINAILVDDEEGARDVLHNLIHRFCPEVNIVAECDSLLKAVDAIREKKPDLVFLDIEMPNYSGYEIVNFFNPVDFEIVFVTAYDKYALKAFEVSAMDYLLKPVEIERLKQAVEKALQKQSLKEQAIRLIELSNSLQSKEIKNLILFEKGNQHLVPIDTIIAIEAQESYCTVHTVSRKYMVSKNLKHFETVLNDNPNFFRVHKSWMISKKDIQSYSLSELSIVLTNNLIAKLSKYKKGEFEQAIQ